MRYSKNEDSVLVGKFIPGSRVTIRILALDTDNELILDDDLCIESGHLPGMFMWSTSRINASNNITDYSNLVYIMSSSTGEETVGKFTYGGYLDKNYEELTVKIEAILNSLPTLTNIDNKVNEVITKLDELNISEVSDLIDTIDLKLDKALTLEFKLDEINDKLTLLVNANN